MTDQPPTSRYTKYHPILYLNLGNRRDPTFRWKSTSRSRISEIRDLLEIWYTMNALTSVVMFYTRNNAPAPSRPYAIWSKIMQTPKLLNLITNHLLTSLKAPTVFLCYPARSSRSVWARDPCIDHRGPEFNGKWSKFIQFRYLEKCTISSHISIFGNNIMDQRHSPDHGENAYIICRTIGHRWRRDLQCTFENLKKTQPLPLS